MVTRYICILSTITWEDIVNSSKIGNMKLDRRMITAELQSLGGYTMRPESAFYQSRCKTEKEGHSRTDPAVPEIGLDVSSPGGYFI